MEQFESASKVLADKGFAGTVYHNMGVILQLSQYPQLEAYKESLR